MSEAKKDTHVKAFERNTLVVSILMAVFAAIICMQIISRIGTTPNTSVIGALFAMALARMPLSSFKSFRSLDRQNLVQTMTSGAGFAAANCCLLSVGIIYVFNDTSLILPMLIGSGLATLIGMHMVYGLFDSELFPASAPWAPGIATAQAIIAGDEGGKKGRTLLGGIILGALGAGFRIKPFLAGGIPMAGVGIAFIANPWSMSALAIGLLIRGYYPSLVPALTELGLANLPADLGKTYIPHGFMIGAGLISLLQAIAMLSKKNARKASEAIHTDSVNNSAAKKAIAAHVAYFAAAALILAVITGFMTSMPAPRLALWVVWCTFSSVAASILVGLCAMHSGWFPGFAVTVIFVSLGLFMNFPPAALAVLAGFVSSTGPCFADMGYDLKTGWLIRGKGENHEYELDGRRQQMFAELLGGFIAVVVVGLLMNMHFNLNLLPPVSRVFAATVKAGSDFAILREMLLWAVPGALIQLAGGSKKGLGILLATGLLIKNPVYGVGLVVALILRALFIKDHEEAMQLCGAGFVAGDGLFGFFNAIGRSFGLW
ncbi:MAG: OPT/YSL family transporter [Pyramidobacter sp.]|nr:OPT/YSL family transporter [Pyramidobacter sp.]